MIEFAKYYDDNIMKWIRVTVLQFEGDYAIVKNNSGRYLRIPISKLQSN